MTIETSARPGTEATTTFTTKGPPAMTDDPFETATVYISKNVPTGYTFRVYSERGEVVKYFNTIDEGVREHSGDIFYFTEPERFEVRVRVREPDVRDYQVFDNLEGRFCDGVFAEELAAEAWADTLRRAEGVPECDISPESVIEVDANAAGQVGGMLRFMRSRDALESGAAYGDLIRNRLSWTEQAQFDQIVDALLELSRDKSVQIVQEEIPL